MTAHHHTHIARLLAVLILAFLGMVSGCAQVPALDDGVYKAGQMFDQGDYDGVIALLQPMADRDPRLSTTSLDLLGMAYYHNHQYPKAAAILERATAPGMFSGMPFGGRRINMRNHGVLGWCHFHMKNLDRAMAAFDKALAKSDFRREPAWDESALRGRAWTRYFQGDFQGAASDMTASQRLAKANPAINSASDDYDRHLAMAYVSLGLQKDRDADTLAHAAVAAAKQTKIPAQIVHRNVAPIYLMLGQRDQAYGLFGGKGTLGIQMQDDPQGGGKGVRVEKTLPDSPARQAGLMPGDIIVAIDGQPVANSQDLASQVGSRAAGQNVQLALLRNGSPLKLAATLMGPDAVIAKHELLQPVLKVRTLPGAPAPVTVAATNATLSAESVESAASQPAMPPEPSGTRTVVVEMPPPVTASAVPQVETPVPPELRIESVRVEPQAVKAGERFELTINLFALDQDLRTETVPVVLRYAISRDGRELARFDPETFQVPNGVPSTIAKKTRTSTTQALGEYRIDLEMEMGPLMARMHGGFSLR